MISIRNKNEWRYSDKIDSSEATRDRANLETTRSGTTRDRKNCTGKLSEAYSPRNDPDPEMILNPEMIPQIDPDMIPTFLLVDSEMIPKGLGNGN